MSNYVPCYESDFTRRELLELAELLRIDIKTAVATWLALNQWAQLNAPNGCLEGISPATIAAAAGLDTKHQGPSLLQALRDARLLDEHGQLTDWRLYGGLLLAARERKAESMRKARSGGGNVDTTETPRGRHVDTTRRPRSAKVEVKVKAPKEEKTTGGESTPAARTTDDYAWVNALVPGAITAAAEAQRFQDVFDSRPDVDHTYELRTMYVKLHEPRRGRSWAEQYASWIRDGKSHKLLPGGNASAEYDEQRNQIQAFARSLTREQYDELNSGRRDLTDEEFQVVRISSARFNDS